jgi:hypothetical protein
MRKILIVMLLAVVSGPALATSLSDIPNESAFGYQVKSIINSNNALVNAWVSGTVATNKIAVQDSVTVGTNLTVSGATVVNVLTSTVSKCNGKFSATDTVTAGTNFIIGATSGWSGSITNRSSLSTNVIAVSGGLITGNTATP